MDSTRITQARVVGLAALGIIMYYYINKDTDPLIYLQKDKLYEDMGGLGMQQRNASAGVYQTAEAQYIDDYFSKVAMGHEELGETGGFNWRLG